MLKHIREGKNKTINPSRARRSEAGLCLRCGSDRQEGKNYCAECREKQRLENAERRSKALSKGLCACGRSEPREGYKRCDACLSLQKKHNYLRRQKSREQGVCLDCGLPAKPQELRCLTCAEKHRAVSSAWYYAHKTSSD